MADRTDVTHGSTIDEGRPQVPCLQPMPYNRSVSVRWKAEEARMPKGYQWEQELVAMDPERLVREQPTCGHNPVAVLSSDTPERVRTLAATWVGLVTYWGQPSAVMLSRTSRYVREFCEQHRRLTISVLPGSSLPELRAGSSPKGVMPQTPIASARPVVVDGHVALEGAELVLLCKLGYASELSDKLKEELAPTKPELRELGRQTAMLGYVERAWTTRQR